MASGITQGLSGMQTLGPHPRITVFILVRVSTIGLQFHFEKQGPDFPEIHPLPDKIRINITLHMRIKWENACERCLAPRSASVSWGWG